MVHRTSHGSFMVSQATSNYGRRKVEVSLCISLFVALQYRKERCTMNTLIVGLDVLIIVLRVVVSALKLYQTIN